MTALGMILRDRTIWLSAFACSLLFGSFMAWAALAPLAEGVTAQGKITVESERKTVQHLEGGMITELFVREGDVVSAGQKLLVLSDIAVQSGRDQLALTLAQARLAIDRLEALEERNSVVRFSLLDDLQLDEASVLEVRARQQSLFNQQRRAFIADIDLLETRRQGLSQNAGNIDAQIAQSKNSLGVIEEELARQRLLVDQRLVEMGIVHQLEREESRVNEDLARLNTDKLSALSQANEVGSQIRVARARALENITQELLENRAIVLEVEEKLFAADDVLGRTIVSAPQSGTVLNLKFATIGGVIQAGEAIMEIVPSSDLIVATVEIRPVDRDAVLLRAFQFRLVCRD